MQALKTKLKKVTSTHRGRKIAFGILIFFIALIAGGLWYWNTHKKAIIKNKLEKAITEKSDSLYIIKYDSLDLDEIEGYLSITNMNLSFDSSRYLQLKGTGNEPSILLKIHIPRISVSGVKTKEAIIGDEIVGRKLEIIKPVINIIYTNTGKDSAKVVPPKEIYEQILGNLNLIKIDSVIISLITGRRTFKCFDKQCRVREANS